MTIAVLATAVAVLGLLLAEHRNHRLGIWLAKPAASTGFVAVALLSGSSDEGIQPYGTWMVAGLVLSWFGDVLLIPEDRPRVFQAGIAAFLLGHVAYGIAFVGLGLSITVTAAAVVILAVPVWIVTRWLAPHVPSDMKIPVRAYIVVITLMLALSAGAVAAGAGAAILFGAGMFYMSDLAVARDRFVAPGFGNRLWGLPTYYAAQLVLAATVGGWSSSV